MMRTLLISMMLFFSVNAIAQNDQYSQSIKAWQQKYIANHEVVKGSDKKYFRFFPIDPAFLVTATFEMTNDTIGLKMRTSAGTEQQFYKYGLLKFTLQKVPCKLVLYQSEELMKTEKYKNYLFMPFTDKTSGSESYGGGRYLEYY